MTSTAISPLGPVQFTQSGPTIHCADERRFDPIAHWSTPDQERPTEPKHKPLLEAPVVPITLIPDTKFVPLYYVVHMSSQRCLHCNVVHESSAVYAYNDIAPRAGMGKRISHLVPVSRFSYNVPLKVQRLPGTTVPACHECARENGIDLSHLPKPVDTAEYQKVIATYHKLATNRLDHSESKDKKPSKAPKTVDSLFEGL